MRTSARKRQTQVKLLEIGGFAVRVTYKRIKNVHLRVQPPDGRVEVSAPHGTPCSLIEDFVHAKRSWIERRRQALANSPRVLAEQASAAEQAEWKTIVSVCTLALIAKWEPVLGVKAGKLAYRNMKSRWGSCQPNTGRICINTRLALYPPECLEYVVVHELCHLRVAGHGPQFWALVGSALPHWKEARAKLRDSADSPNPDAIF